MLLVGFLFLLLDGIGGELTARHQPRHHSHPEEKEANHQITDKTQLLHRWAEKLHISEKHPETPEKGNNQPALPSGEKDFLYLFRHTCILTNLFVYTKLSKVFNK